MNKNDFWDLKAAIAKIDLVDSDISDSITASFNNDVRELLRGGDIANVVNKVEQRSNLYAKIIEFYKFIEMSNIDINPSLLEVLKIWELYPKYFHLRLFPHFIRIFKSPLPFEEILKRLDIIHKIDVKTDFFNNKYNILSFEKKVKMVILTEDFYHRLAVLRTIEEIRWWLLADDIWFVFRWRGVNMDNLSWLHDMFMQYWDVDESLRMLYVSYQSVSNSISKKRECLKSWSNIFSWNLINTLCNSKNITFENLVNILDIMRAQSCDFPENEFQDHNFLRFILNYFDPTCMHLCYDDSSKTLIDKWMYSLEELISLGMHLKSDEVPF